MNILIVDDEKIVLQTVLQQVKNLALEQLECIDAAGSAEEARTMLSRREYHIFLCDIVMPGEDGITFAKWILSRYPYSKFIFLTAHADFKYMREAVSIKNSFDYLLKPSHSHELREVLSRAVMQIQIEQKNRDMMRKALLLQQHEDSLVHGMVSGFLNGKDSSVEFVERLLWERLPENDRRRKGVRPFVCAAYVQSLTSGSAAPDAEGRILCKSSYENMLSEIVDASICGSFVWMEENGDAMVFLAAAEPERLAERAEQYWESFRILNDKISGTETAVYLGSVRKVKELCGCHDEFLYWKENNQKRRGGVFTSRSSGQSIEMRKRALLWQQLLGDKEYRRFVESIEGTLLFDSERGRITKQYLLHMHEYVTEILLNYMVSQKIESRSVFDEGLPYVSYMGAYRSVGAFLDALRYVAARLEKEKAACVDFIEAARAYIESNLYQNISVTDVAEHIGINPEYLTRLFRKKTGYNVKEFIVNERIEAAKHLLRSTDLPVTIVSSQVGYGSYSNFTHTFKQLVGVTPMEYRKQEEKGR